ncbi:hypothetical protein [Mycobacterium sp. PSTR-4-N]|uniref:hypothetical protein n=1 Tax=Mycobacterium sp. PSTR-4-N TaxID=2917745 RepID=UPI001F14AD2F|nr:hypothetical protein [Mycobacterium sp. PSTR-4-N]MCG7595935.1 hypothetical protein [Mycobacterium sp. PSTR-4-N]
MRNRRRDARHPIVLASMGTLSYISASQLWFGPSGSTVVREMDRWSQNAFSAVLLASTLACIAAAWLRREPRGAWVEMLGMLGCSAALFYYSRNIPEAVPTTWNTSMALAFTGTAIGAAVRAGLVWRMIRRRDTW